MTMTQKALAIVLGGMAVLGGAVSVAAKGSPGKFVQQATAGK